MNNVAILIGNTEYKPPFHQLHCCADDLKAIAQLIGSTQKFEAIETILNKSASELKETLRAVIDNNSPINEIFFYYTGHGFQGDGEFYICPTDFSKDHPNETGLSTAETHMLLRSSEARIVVKVLDACFSGALLIKNDGSFLPIPKDGLSNIIQIASCLDSQTSLTGNPLSIFTQKFIEATLRKQDGIIYYSDITNNLRDEFLGNNSQTPHFISQGTGREQFVDDATKLREFREIFLAEKIVQRIEQVVDHDKTPVQVLMAAEHAFPKQEGAQQFINNLKESLTAGISETNFGEFFDLSVYSHSDYIEQSSREFNS